MREVEPGRTTPRRYELADTNDLAVIDITAMYGTCAAANTAGLMYDSAPEQRRLRVGRRGNRQGAGYLTGHAGQRLAPG